MRNLYTKCVVIHKTCKYVTFYTLSFLCPTPPMQYHFLPFSSSYFHLNLNSTIKFISQVLLIHKSECTKELFSPLPFCQFSTNCPCSSYLPVVLHPHITFVIHPSLFFISSLFPSLHSPFGGSQRKLGMCKGGGLSPFPVCPPSGVWGPTK